MATNTSVIIEMYLETQVSLFFIIFIFPLCIYILHLGFNQWKAKRNDPSWFINYSDFFTYNLIIMNLVGCAAYVSVLCVIFYDREKGLTFFTMGCFSWYGEMLFPVYMVIEHYVAVVHPMTYLSLKTGRGRLIRNISTGLAWVVTLVLMTIIIRTGYNFGFYIADTCQMVVYLGTIFYCNVAVLKVLILPKPGGAVRDKGQVEKSKRYAFFVIVLVLVVLSLRLLLNVLLGIFWGIVKLDQSKGFEIFCGMISYWVNSLTCLLLPLLYLQRAGKLQQCGRRFGIRR